MLIELFFVRNSNPVSICLAFLHTEFCMLMCSLVKWKVLATTCTQAPNSTDKNNTRTSICTKQLPTRLKSRLFSTRKNENQKIQGTASRAILPDSEIILKILKKKQEEEEGIGNNLHTGSKFHR